MKTITFEKLITSLNEEPAPFGGKLPTYVMIPYEHAKQLAELHAMKATILKLVEEMKVERDGLRQAIGAMQHVPQESPKTPS